MLYIVVFEDNPERVDARPKYLDDHLTFLERHAHAILEAGPLKDAPTGVPAGGIWIVDAPGVAAVKALYEADPFWTAGLRKSVRVLEWTRVFAGGKRLI